MELLTKADIIVINYKTIKAHGGNYVPPYNFLHEDNLDYIVDIIEAKCLVHRFIPQLRIRQASIFTISFVIISSQMAINEQV